MCFRRLKVHIPRGLGISTILYGICGMMCALPFFIQDKSMYNLYSTMPTTNTTEKIGGQPIPMCMTNSTMDQEDNCTDTNSAGNHSLQIPAAYN